MKNLQNLATLASLGNSSQGAGAIQYLLKDTFSTDLAAGAVNGTQADVGGVRTVIDTNSKISISGGLLSFATGAAVSDAVSYPSLTRVSGRMAFADIVSPDNSNAVYLFGWGGSEVFRLNGGGANVLGVVVNNTSTLNVGAIAISTAYKLAIVLRPTGVYLFIKGGAFTNWNLVHHYNVGILAGSVKVFVQSTTVVATADNIRVPQNLWLPTPLAYDTFTR